jgi:4-amino-4-deoxy-L-arabinose transferase-like glycosyltransferase
MPLTLIYSRTVIPDPALLFVETATLVAAWRGFEDGAPKGRWFALAWALMGLGIVTKGPVALIVPLLIVITWALVADLPLRSFFAMRAWPWVFVTALPWLIAVSLHRPDFLRYAIIDESIGRLTTSQHQRTAPVWFFVPVLLLGAFPWTVPALAALVVAVRRWSARRSAAGRAAAFAAAWALVPLVFFTLPKSKLPGYVLPALPGVAIGVALYLAHARSSDSARTGWLRMAWIAAGCILGLAILAGVGSPFAGKVTSVAPRAREALELFARHAAGVLAVAAAMLAWAAIRRNGPLATAAFALPVAAIPFVSVPLLEAIGRDRSSLELAAAIERAAPGAQLVGVAAYPTSLRYYVDRPFLLSSDTALEMTSNYVASRSAEFRKLPDSPLRPAAWWRSALVSCETPLVFIVRDDSPDATVLAAKLPRIANGGASGRFIAYGPCRPDKQAEGRR